MRQSARTSDALPAEWPRKRFYVECGSDFCSARTHSGALPRQTPGFTSQSVTSVPPGNNHARGDSAVTMKAQAKQVRQLISRSQAIQVASLVAELSRAIACCKIATITSDAEKGLCYLLVAEATSAKFMRLRSQGKFVESTAIEQLMFLLEEGLGGRLWPLSFNRNVNGDLAAPNRADSHGPENGVSQQKSARLGWSRAVPQRSAHQRIVRRPPISYGQHHNTPFALRRG